jgi:hypothetical protein
MRFPHRAALALAGLFASLSCHAQMGGDLEAQILYAYQTEDANELADLRQMLEALLKIRSPNPKG